MRPFDPVDKVMEEEKTTEERAPEELDEILKHHEPTGTSSVKKPDDTPGPRLGKLENSEEEEDDVPMYGTGGSRQGIGLPDHPTDGPQEALEVDGVLSPKVKESK